MTTRHTTTQFDQDLDRLKELLLLMGGTIESMLQDAAEALAMRSLVHARRIIERDEDVDALEKLVDQRAIEILALRQPTAGDLRFVCAAFKICTDLERMGDIVVNICERVIELDGVAELKNPAQLSRLFRLTKEIISRSLDCFVNQSTLIASEVLLSDQEIDTLTREIYSELMLVMKSESDKVERGMRTFFIAKHLERMADHACNIAEQVVFMVKGLDIRHSHAPGPTPYV